jgi:glyoxylase-like metal-dependent hydrolase (beta-lactamase superfamily II)
VDGGRAVTVWTAVGDGVLARTYAELDLTVGLVLGADRCLVVDTRGDAEQGAELAAAVREVTALPWTVAVTHAHFDHAFGTAAFPGAEVWAHEDCARELRDNAESYRAGWLARYEAEGRLDAAAALRRTEVVVPDRTVTGRASIDLGGREVQLAHHGPGHTGHDLVVRVPDAGVVFAGDLLERAETGSFSAESFGPDSDLRSWPDALAALLDPEPRIVVPGHGAPAGPGFVRRQRAELLALAELRDAVAAGEITALDARTRSPLPPVVTEAGLGAGWS